MEKIFSAKTEEAAKEQAINEFKACGISESDITFEILEDYDLGTTPVSVSYNIELNKAYFRLDVTTGAQLLRMVPTT